MLEIDFPDLHLISLFNNYYVLFYQSLLILKILFNTYYSILFNYSLYMAIILFNVQYYLCAGNNFLHRYLSTMFVNNYYFYLINSNNILHFNYSLIY